MKSDQSEDERSPRFAADADGTLKVMVLPAPVMVKSEPEVDVANVMVEPFCVWPAGPIALMLPDPEPQSLPVPVTFPEASTWRHCVDPVTFASVSEPARRLPVVVAFPETVRPAVPFPMVEEA